MSASIVNLMYFAAEDTFYFVDLRNMEAGYRGEFINFIGDVIDAVNMPNPSYNIGLEYANNTVSEVNIGNIGDPIGYFTRDTGDGAFPFSQGMQLSNIPAAQVLTNYDPNTTYNFSIRVQSTDYDFSTTGDNLETYQDVINLVTSNSPAQLEYFSTTRNPDNTPSIKFSSNVVSNNPNTGGNTGQGSIITSRIAMTVFANQSTSYNVTTGSSDGVRASFRHYLPEPAGADILTNVPSNDDTVFEFSVGTNKNLVVRGFQARTYQDLVDTLNLFNGVNAIYRMDGAQKHQVYLYSPVPKSPKIDDTISDMNETDPEIITKNATLRGALESYAGNSKALQIDDFSGLTTNSPITHILKNSIVGGYNMLTVLQNSKRSNGSYWTEIVPIESDKKSSDDVVSKVPEQKALVEAIEADASVPDDVKRKASLNLGSIISISGALLGGSESLKSAIISAAIAKIPNLLAGFSTPTAPTPPEAVEPVIDEVIDTGYEPGALDANGNVLDETKLTSAQKSKLLPPDRTTVG